MENLGEKLKSLRLDLGLTQTEMAAGVISVSFYSKVERGLHSIGAEELLEILKRHDINVASFFSDEKKENVNRKKLISLMNKFVKVATEDNDNEIKGVILDLEKIKPQTPLIESLILQAKLISNTHDTESLKKLTNQQKQKMKQIVFQKDTDENEYFRIVIFANLIRIYSLEEANFLIKSITRRYSNVNGLEKKMEVALSVLMVNYINWCIEQGKFDYSYEALKYLTKLPNIIELAFTKILGQYFDDLIDHKFEEAKNIRKILNKSGYETIVNKMVK